MFEHLTKLGPQDILVIDRGYQVHWLIVHLTLSCIHFYMLANGRIHILMTSLLDGTAYPAANFAAFRHGR
jgi:hypothetical protein